MNKKNNVKNSKKVKDAVNAFISKDSLKSDPNGYYTGNPIDKNEKPVQDQDDL